MVRFDIVVATMGRSELFWNSLDNLKNFDLKKDRIIFFDCSNNPVDELEKCQQALKKLGWKTPRFKFYHRRNWCFNHGSQLDYLRLLGEDRLDRPQLCYFMQDHYLNKKEVVRNDTIPDKEIIDLNLVEDFFRKHPDGVFFCSRMGFRISASVPDIGEFIVTEYGVYNQTKHPGSKDTCFVIDGANYALDPAYYLNDYKKSPSLYVSGNGSYGFTHVWETRLCKILYDKKMFFYEASRKMGFRTIEDLQKAYPKPEKVWHYFHHMPAAYIVYGRDIYKYSWFPRNFQEFRRLASWSLIWLKEAFQANRSRTITLEWETNE